MLREEKERWEALLDGLSVARIVAPGPGGWALDQGYRGPPDGLAADQQCPHAGRPARGEPQYPSWPAGLDFEADNVDQLNAWIFATYQHQDWTSVFKLWGDGFQRLLDITQAIPESDLLENGHYRWLSGYPLATVLVGTYEHHHIEHYEPLLAWLSGEANQRLPKNERIAALVRRSYTAFREQDRAAMEALLDDDFTFNSPRDDHIDKAILTLESSWLSTKNFR